MKLYGIARISLASLIAIGSFTSAHAQGHSQDRGRGNRPDFHFNDQSRQQFQQHYRSDVNRYQSHPNMRRRPNFAAGQRIPSGYAIRTVPRSYYGNTPPPPGYRYGYYNGYVVAYDPTTRIIADVLDLVTGN